MEHVKEQRVCVKFCFKVGITDAEAHNMLSEAYSDDASFALLQASATGAGFFPITEALCIMNSFLKVRKLIKILIWWF
jgi:hypothetical protein